MSVQWLRHDDVVVHADDHEQTVDGDPRIENGDDVIVTFTDGSTAEFDSWAQVRAFR